LERFVVLPKELIQKVDDFIVEKMHWKQSEFAEKVKGPLLIFSSEGILFIVNLHQVLMSGRTKIVLGRSKTIDLLFSHSGVSRRHAEIVYHKPHWYIRDCGSRNGVLKLDGQERTVLRSNQPSILEPDVRFGLGKGARLQIYSSLGIYRKIRERREEVLMRSTESSRLPIPSEVETIAEDFLIPNGQPKDIMAWSREMRADSMSDFIRRANCFFVRLLTHNPKNSKYPHADDTLIAEEYFEHSGGQSPLFWPLLSKTRGPDVLLGRAAANDIVLNEGTVSRKHMAFHFDGQTGSWIVEDLGSKNGLYVDGKGVLGRHSLEDEARIQVGKEVLLQFHSPQTFYGLLKIYSKISAG
jgi:pSer/pThr/pTyr-binding forkhead associated (FHA) protein